MSFHVKFVDCTLNRLKLALCLMTHFHDSRACVGESKKALCFR